MSQAIGTLDKSFISGEDLTAKKYYAVYLSGDQTVSLCATGHLNAVGILQNDPNTGEGALVRLEGTSKAVASGAIAVGTRVVATADGKIASVAAAGADEQDVIGVALEAAAADGDIIEIALIHESYVKGTA